MDGEGHGPALRVSALSDRRDPANYPESERMWERWGSTGNPDCLLP